MRFAPVLIVCGLIVGGCRSGPTARVRTADGVVEQRVDSGGRAAMERAAQEIPCSGDEMTLQLLGGGGYRVEGCGTRITYTCVRGGWNVLCDPDERESLTPPRAPVVEASTPVQASVAMESVASTPAVEPASPTVAAPPSALEMAVRAAVDARAPAILACVDDVALAVQVSWTGEGQLDAQLRGQRHGSPEEACVRAAVQQGTVTAPGSAGTMLHAVQR